MAGKRSDGGYYEWSRNLFWVYLTALVIIVIFKNFNHSVAGWFDAMAGRVNMTPFHQLAVYIKMNQVTVYAQNIWGNILPFIPLGVLLPMAYPRVRRIWYALAVGLLMIVGFETAQLVSGYGYFDIDDILLNLASVAIGFGLWRVTVGRG